MKEYSKPDIVFDSFSLSTSIAAGCAVKTNTPAAMHCGVEFGPDTIFTASVEACTDIVGDNDYYDGMCYHNPSESSNLFNS